MKKLTKNLQENISAIKEILPQEDVLVFSFSTAGGTDCAVVYTDGITDKNLLGEQVLKPLSAFQGKAELTALRQALFCPEVKDGGDLEECASGILDGDCLLLFDGITEGTLLGVKTLPARAVTEPPTDVAVRGPRAGFIEDIKTNLSLIHTRIKTPALRMKNLSVGKQSKTKVCLVYLDGIADEKVVAEMLNRLNKVEIDNVADSSYIAKILVNKPFSLFKQCGSTEKPDVLCAEILEGRVGVLVDGSPIGLSLPYVAIQDFQSSEDYFINPYRATATRLLRFFSLFIAIYLPAFYVTAQLFKIQLIPTSLIFTVASGVQGIPLSPSLEMVLVLFVLEVLNEASIRMPKYVGYALSIVGALVLGDTVVQAGLVSTTAIIIIAISGICLYTVPNLYETTSILRWIMLFIAGSIGPYGLVLFTAFLLYYMITDDNYGVPLLSPLSPWNANDNKDAVIRVPLFFLWRRPKVFKSRNERRLRHRE